MFKKSWCTLTVVVLFTKPNAFLDVLVTVAVDRRNASYPDLKGGREGENEQDVASLSFFSFPWSLTLCHKSLAKQSA